MPKNYQKLFRTNGLTARVTKRKDNVFRVSIRRDGLHIEAYSKDLEEAKAKFITKLAAAEQKPFPSKSKNPIIFPDLVYKYLTEIKQGTIVEKSLKNKLNIWKNHINVPFSKKTVNEITSEHLAGYIQNLIKTGKGRIAEDFYTIINETFKWAVNEKIINTNPCENIQFPKHKRKNGVSIPRKYIISYLKKSVTTRYDRAIHILLYTGMRPCEMASIKYDANKDFILIKNAKQPINTEPTWRRIPIHNAIKDLIAEFISDETKGLNCSNLEAYFKTCFPAQYHLYCLRHTFTSVGLECGIPKILIDELLNHTSSGNITDKVYKHFSEEYYIRQINKLKFDFLD